MTEFDVINQQGARIAALEREVERLKRERDQANEQKQNTFHASRRYQDVVADMASLIEAAKHIMECPGVEEMLAKVRRGEVL